MTRYHFHDKCISDIKKKVGSSVRWHNPQIIRDLIIELTSTPSISGTIQERDMADKIYRLLHAYDYFQLHPEQLRKHPIPHDKLSRDVITALLRGNNASNKTIVMLSHYDVVGIEDFGRFKSNASHPEALTSQLRTESSDVLDKDAFTDLMSGKWLFGRGVMDMKAGLAIQIAMMEHFSTLEDFSGNLLLLATPDEETNSEGMLEAVSILNHLKEQYQLDYELCICSEANWSSFPGDDAKYIYTGSVGKLLPMVFSVGTSTHVGEPLRGVNAAWMSAEIVNRIELSTDFVDELDGEYSPYPTCLDARIIKDRYNVQTPNLAYAMFNVLTLKQSPKDVLYKLRDVTNQVADKIYRRIVERNRTNGDHSSQGDKLSHVRPKIYSYSELYQKGVECFGNEFVQNIDEEMNSFLETQTDPRIATVQLVQRVSSFFVEEAPFFVLLFAPPYYPHVYLDDLHDQRIQAVVEKVHQDALQEDDNVRIKRFFPGLSDVSYCRIRDADRIMETLKPNMPLLDFMYNVPIEEISKLNLPTINIGPYGKDAHQWTERLELTYSTEVAPQLVMNTIHYVFAK